MPEPLSDQERKAGNIRPTREGGSLIRRLGAWFFRRRMRIDLRTFRSRVWEQSRKQERYAASKLKAQAREPDTVRAMEIFKVLQTDPASGHTLLVELADQGSPWAMEELAISHESGRYVKLDLNKSLRWYHKAVKASSFTAVISFARVLDKLGHHDRCDKFLSNNLDIGFPAIHFWLAWYRIKRSKSKNIYKEVKPLLEYASKNGHIGAQVVFANSMARGRFGILDIPKGLKMLAKLHATAGKAWDAEPR